MRILVLFLLAGFGVAQTAPNVVARTAWFTAVSSDGKCAAIPDAAAIALREDGKPATLSAIEQAAAHGARYVLVVDASGSGRNQSGAIRAALDTTLDFLRTSLRSDRDQVALIMFNDEAYLDQPFTTDLNQLANTLRTKLELRGGTALYDALAKASSYARKQAAEESTRVILLLLSDGLDNASHSGLRQAVQALQWDGAAVVAMQLRETVNSPTHAMRELAAHTGGVLLQADNPRRLAADLASARLLVDCGWLARYTSSAKTATDHRLEIRISSDPHATVLAPDRIPERTAKPMR